MSFATISSNPSHLKHPGDPRAAPRDVIALREITFRRDGRDILRNITLSVRSGEHWALLGPNGAGKSTILSLCGAVNHPTSGHVYVLGEMIGRVELQALRRAIGHVNPRHSPSSPLTVLEIVLTGITGTNEVPARWRPTDLQSATAHNLISQFGLDHKVFDRWPTLSQGQRGRALLARALISEPALLLLDEPSTGLDVAGREQLLKLLDSLDHSHPTTASILVTHHLEELPPTTTHAAIVADGAVIASGRVEEVITTENVSRAFNYPITVECASGRWSARATTVT